MEQRPKIRPEWSGKPSVVAAPGPSLTHEIAETVRATGWPVLVCQDAWRLFPWADKLYGCDSKWWNHYNGVPDFTGEKWTTRDSDSAHHNYKAEEIEKYGLQWVLGAPNQGFSLDPSLIHFGDNSGFQSINLAILLGSPYIVLVGFDMSDRGVGHFFGQHPQGLYQQDNYEQWVPKFERAAKELPADVTIVNATPGSAMRCFKMMELESAIAHHRLFSNGAVNHAAAG